MTERISPLVSVVMGVYNGAGSLAATVDSVLSQQDCDFEFVIVNDGSTDNTGALLNEYAKRDARVRVLHQANTGLTRALIAGCAAARGEFIARQDAGDISLPGRLAQQTAVLSARPEVVLVCCAVRVVAPEDELLFDISRTGADLERGLLVDDYRRIQGPPHHGSTMFRRSAYLQVGGYRPSFIVAQDIDLWLRLAEIGRCWGLTSLGYRSRVEANSISGRRRDDQLRLTALAVECSKQRRSGEADASVLANFVLPPRQIAKPMSGSEHAKFLYFVGACLIRHDRTNAKKYLRKAVVVDPWAVKARLRLMLGW